MSGGHEAVWVAAGMNLGEGGDLDVDVNLSELRSNLSPCVLIPVAVSTAHVPRVVAPTGDSKIQHKEHQV